MRKNSIKTYITGMGAITSACNSTVEFENALKYGKSKISYSNSKNINNSKVICGEIMKAKIDNLISSYRDMIDVSSYGIIKRLLHRTPLQLFVEVVTVLEAFIKANLYQIPVSGERVSIIITGNNLTDLLQQSFYDKAKVNPEYLPPSLALQFMDTYHVGVISEVFGIHGEGFTVGGASASGNVGIIKGKQLIDLGIADVCIVIGAMADLTDMELQAFYNIGALGGKYYKFSPEQACRPFDIRHEGFIYGQGCGCLVLENEMSVKKRNIVPLAELRGGVMQLDGNHSSNPNVEREIQTMQRAMMETSVEPQEINYINAHGTSSPLGDETELQAIEAVFEENIKNIWVNSTKGIIGHCLYSAGVLEAIASVIQMRAGFVHPNINLDNPINESLKLVGKSMVPANIKMALSNSFGFGGINTSILINKI